MTVRLTMVCDDCDNESLFICKLCCPVTKSR